MCTTNSSVWAQYPDGRKEKLLEDVVIVRQDSETVVIGRYFQEPVRLAGTIYEVDFSNSTVTLSLVEAVPADLPGSSHIHVRPRRRRVVLTHDHS